MQATVDLLVKQYFRQDNFEQLSEQEIIDFLNRHPFASWGNILLALKRKSIGLDFEKAATTAALHMNNPLWLQAVLEETVTEKAFENIHENITGSKIESVTGEEQAFENVVESDVENLSDSAEEKTSETAQTAVETGLSDHSGPADPNPIINEEQIMAKTAEFRPIPKPAETIKPAAEETILFEPYHTIDYFASQGIKLNADDLAKDKFGRQLKSFTEWLRSMKKIPQGGQLNISSPSEEPVDQSILQKADASVETSEVDTEAMAEVWAKQGKKARAIEIYQKLSLLNPSKSHYFAAKIEQLNA